MSNHWDAPAGFATFALNYYHDSKSGAVPNMTSPFTKPLPIQFQPTAAYLDGQYRPKAMDVFVWSGKKGFRAAVYCDPFECNGITQEHGAFYLADHMGHPVQSIPGPFWWAYQPCDITTEFPDEAIESAYQEALVGHIQALKERLED